MSSYSIYRSQVLSETLFWIIDASTAKSSARLIFFVDEIDHRKYAEKANTITEGYYENKIPDGHLSPTSSFKKVIVADDG